MVKAGWFLQFRIFGIAVDRLPSGYAIGDLKDRESHPHRRVECLLTAEPQVPGGIGQVPVLIPGTIPAGEWQIELTPPSTIAELQAPSVWFSVHAMDEYSVGAELEFAWRSGDRESRRQLLSALDRDLLTCLRPRAELVAGLWSVLYGRKVFAPSISSPTLWTSERSWMCMASRSFSDVVEPEGLSQQEIENQVAVVCANVFAPEEREVEILRRASTWYLRAKGETQDSMERFVWFFLSLEALTYLVDQKADADVLTKYSRLRELVGEDEPELSVFLSGLGGRLGQAPLALRFRRLTERYSKSTADEDVSAFAEFAVIRNKLLHGDLVAQGTAFEALSLNDRIGSLSFRYLSAIINTRFQTTRSRLVRG